MNNVEYINEAQYPIQLVARLTGLSAHEHFVSAALRVFLGNSAKPFGASDHTPVLIVATPAGQVHELGALLVGAAAANLGWQVTYLGASLPAAEIACAAQQRRAQAVDLSLVYPEDDPGQPAQACAKGQTMKPLFARNLKHWLFVGRDVEHIFQYRQQRMQELFGTKPGETVHPASNR